ncbi:MAG: DUF1272 domain-containing protein [Chthoniobacterales bacterium]|nr:DUF1272 domain-containing protein [Chthoniobacterales bacterium]
MALEIKEQCQLCNRSLAASDEAYICVYECTFCPKCTAERVGICPNCGGELVRRPRPKATH